MSDSDSSSDGTTEVIQDEPDPWPTPPTGKKTALTLSKNITKLNDKDLRALIQKRARERYGEEAKEIQISAVMDLVRRRNSFVLAGTGYGKSRIAEMYWDLFPKYKKAVVLSLNPLDTLGDNQVEEKKNAKNPISAVNLTKMNLTDEVAREILQGKYSFIYLSPEVLLNSSIFHDIFFDRDFRDRLISTVVDEAHMVFIWGLVASGRAKKIISHLKHQDRAIFRPLYGKLGSKLILTNGVPILLLSATCRPVAIAGILKSLKLTEDNISFSRAELTRPEIRILRVTMTSSFKSCDDLSQLYGPQSQTPDEKVVPSLVYGTSRASTMQALKSANTSRGTIGGQNNPYSNFARRYHSCTGDKTKLDVINDFSQDKVAVISCTMALGLGQNWKRVRMVVHFGRGDPASLFQMIGRTGRDGRPGLAIIFVEPHRKNGKNCVEDFEDDDPMNQTEDDRMDAFAITPVCLRIAFSLDNLLGYIPLRCNDPNVVLEKEREIKSGFVPCGCSNCKPEEHCVIMRNLKNLSVDNFTSFLARPVDLPSEVNLENPVTLTVAEVICPAQTKRPLAPFLESFATHLVDRFRDFFTSEYDLDCCYFEADEVFGIQDARAAVLATEKGFQKDRLEAIVGGLLTSQMEFLHICIEDYRRTKTYKEYTRVEQAKSAAQSLILSNSQPIPVEHYDPSIFASSSALQQGPKKTKKQQEAEKRKLQTAAKRELRKAQKAVDDHKRKEEAKRKKEERAKKQAETDANKENRVHQSSKRKASKDVGTNSKAKSQKRARVESESQKSAEGEFNQSHSSGTI
ncbi:hypothetical protein MJO29_010439 [Puccinia striiformis f. sp. tritici]|nr:hypothetical protein MJO29_010439 [Puccinia striiformis f. sp. tritici]